jgi:hypothetical protein
MIQPKPIPERVVLEREREIAKLLVDWWRLRRMGKLEPLLQDGPNYYTFSNPFDPWGSKERVSVEWIREQVEREKEKLSLKKEI